MHVKYDFPLLCTDYPHIGTEQSLKGSALPVVGQWANYPDVVRMEEAQE